MTDPAPATAGTTYDLYDLQNGKRFFWRNPNHGVALVDAGRDSAIVWRNDAIEVGRQLWTDITAVNMSSVSAGTDAANNCLIRFRDGRTLTVTDAGPSGQVDHDRTPPYRDFVRALHRRRAPARLRPAPSAGGIDGLRRESVLVSIESLATKRWRSLSHRERVGVRGYSRNGEG